MIASRKWGTIPLSTRSDLRSIVANHLEVAHD
jgi:hypothetical protein